LDAAEKIDEATAEFEAAVKAKAPEPQAHFALGYLYWKQKRFSDAAGEFRAELIEQPRDGQSMAYLGDCEMHAGDEKAAADHLATALRSEPAMRLAHLDLGILLASGTDKAEAERHLREAIRLDPEKTEAHYQLGRLLRATGREPEAAAEF